jgi:hypothetical protein
MRRTGSSACANTGASAPKSTMAATAVNVFIANLPFTILQRRGRWSDTFLFL